MKNLPGVIVFLSCMFLFSLSMKGQTKTIKGTVTAFGGIAVEKAEVMIKKTKTSVFTDSDGFFSIECKEKDKIAILASGFKKKTVKVSDLPSSGEVQLTIAKGEKGVQKAIASGHIAQTVSVEAVKFVNRKPPYALGFTNMEQLVKAKFPNLEVTGSEVIVRGRTSRTSSGALIVLNGATYSWSSVSTFNVTDIKNIKLYTGSEASRFGPGSGNGVLEIILMSDEEEADKN